MAPLYNLIISSLRAGGHAVSTPVSVTQAARHFADYINRVVYRGDRFLLLRGNRPVAELGPVPAARRLGDLPTIMAALPRLTAEEAEGFARDIEASRVELAHAGVRDPRAS